MNRMILFGGSFNPIHIGHLWMARAAMETLGAGEVLFMPTGDSPHKGSMLSARHRGEMVRLACADNEGFVFSDYEIRAPYPSYTIRTVDHLLQEDPERKIWLLIGDDSLLQFHTWKEYETLLQKVTLAVVPRHHTMDTDTKEQIRLLREKGASIHRIPMNRIELSSTWLRQRARLGKTLQNYVPETVRRYIDRYALYEEEELSEMLGKLKRSIGTRRYAHSLRVAETARDLAEIHGYDKEKALFAGLLHDCAKGREDDYLKDPLVRKSFHETDEPKPLWHTYIGPAVAKRFYGVDDADVLRAIVHHTTGHETMKPLDKILYIADKTEPGRSDPANVELLALAKTDLEEAFYRVMEASVGYLREKGQLVHPHTEKLFTQLQKERQFDGKNKFDSQDASR